MNFSQLIKTLIDYLDLGKRIDTTIPGIVLASVLVLFFLNPRDLLDYRALVQQAAQLQQNQLRLELSVVKSGQEGFRLGADQSKTQDELKNLRAQLNQDQWAQLTSSYTGILQQSFYSILLLGLGGFAIGTVLDPINKALFLQVIPEMGQRANNKIASYVSGHSILESAKDSCVARHRDRPIAAMVGGQTASRMTAQFYIGRGLISAAEYGDLIDNYYRFTEVSIGMIIPVLTVAAGVWYVSAVPGASGNPGEWIANPLVGPGAMCLAVLIAIVLHRVGLRRYGEFHGQVFDLIAGREQAREDQSAQVSKDQVVTLARALTRVEQVAGKLDQAVEHATGRFEGRVQHVEELARRIEEAARRMEPL